MALAVSLIGSFYLEVLKMPHNQNDKFLRLKDVLKIYPVSKSTWWVGVKSGKFPQPVKLSERTTAWRASDIQKLVDSIGGAV